LGTLREPVGEIGTFFGVDGTLFGAKLDDGAETAGDVDEAGRREEGVRRPVEPDLGAGLERGGPFHLPVVDERVQDGLDVLALEGDFADPWKTRNTSFTGEYRGKPANPVVGGSPKSDMNFKTSFELARERFLAARGPDEVAREASSFPYKYLGKTFSCDWDFKNGASSRQVRLTLTFYL